MGCLAMLPEQFVKEGLGCVNWIDVPKRLDPPRRISSPYRPTQPLSNGALDCKHKSQMQRVNVLTKLSVQEEQAG